MGALLCCEEANQAVLELWKWYVRRMWKSLEPWSSQVLACYNRGLKGNSAGSGEEPGAHSPGDSEGHAHRTSWNTDSTKSLTPFCTSSENVRESGLTRNGLACLVETL